MCIGGYHCTLLIFTVIFAAGCEASDLVKMPMDLLSVLGEHPDSDSP